MRYLNQKSHAKAVTVVMASCILHNIAIMENDNADYYFDVRGRVQVCASASVLCFQLGHL